MDILRKAQELTQKYECDIFVEYHGHIDSFSLRVFENGWYDEADADRTLHLVNIDVLENFLEDYEKGLKQCNG